MQADGARTRDHRSTAGTIIYVLIGPIAWALHLSLLYFSQSMLCAHGLAGQALFGAGIVPMAVAAATAAGLSLVLASMLAPERTARLLRASGWSEGIARFNTRVMMALALLSGLGIGWAGVAVLILPACGQGR